MATVHVLLRNYTGGLSRSVCADTIALCKDSITIPLGLEVLELLLETHGAALGALGLWPCDKENKCPNPRERQLRN